MPVDHDAHAVDRCLTLVRALGVPAAAKDVAFPLPAGTRPEGVSLPKKFLVLHPFSRGKGKSLTSACVQALCDCLSPHPIVIVGRSGTTATFTGPHVTSMLNRTSLLDLTWLLRHAHAAVSVDSGPMHIAAALQARTLGIHTWSDPRKVGPYPPTARVWKAGRIAPRNDFTDEEASDKRQVESGDIRRIADYILQQWYRD